MGAAIFRDWSEYLDHVQNVLSKSCLPSQCYTLYVKQKKFCRALNVLGTRLVLECYAGLVDSGFLCKAP